MALAKSCLFLIFVSALMVSANEEAWNKFKLKLGAKYSAKEEAHRKSLFLKVDKMISDHNKENHPWKMKHSAFSVMTEEEKQKYYGYSLPDDIELLRSSKKSYSSPSSRISPILPGLPKQLDYRNDPCMSPVRSQGPCGNCWSYSALQPVEFASCKNRGNKLIVLSENFVKDCTYPWNPKNTGCGGGFPGKFYDMLAFNETQRVADRAKYPPYKPVGAPCEYTPDMGVEDTRVIDWAWIKGETRAEFANNMLEVLNNNMTISTGVYIPSDWSAYGSGVYINKTNCDIPANHAVVIVGYGTMDNLDYWIIRNSWGDWWGDKGYVKMRRGINQCRIELAPMYPILM